MKLNAEQQSYVKNVVLDAIDSGFVEQASPELITQLLLVARCRPEHRQYAHCVAARAFDLGLHCPDVERILRTLTRFSRKGAIFNDFVHWMWDNYGSKPGAYMAFNDCQHLREQAIEQIEAFEKGGL